jgi:hypothetical protein
MLQRLGLRACAADDQGLAGRRQISRKHVELVRRELATWDNGDKRVAQVKQLAGQFLA